MNEDIKKEWLDGLTSGEYVKGVGRLKKGDCYCVMGVLCDIMAKRGIGMWVKNGYYSYNGEVNGYSINEGLAKRVGLDPIPLVRYQGRQTELMVLNDALNLSFNEISEIIQEQL